MQCLNFRRTARTLVPYALLQSLFCLTFCKSKWLSFIFLGHSLRFCHMGFSNLGRLLQKKKKKIPFKTRFVGFSLQFQPAGKICREDRSVCDLPEYCNGSSGTCPTDLFKQDGTPCGDNDRCYDGHCHSHEAQCRALFGRGKISHPRNCQIVSYGISPHLQITLHLASPPLSLPSALKKSVFSTVTEGSLFTLYKAGRPRQLGQLLKSISTCIKNTTEHF